MIPALNTGALLRNLLTNLLIQREKYPETEIIVVDDGSSDDMSFLDRLPIKVLHHPENQGVSAARNDGLRMATGEYLTFLDSDDDVVTDYLDIIYRNMRAGYDWVSFDYLWDGKKRKEFYTKDPVIKFMCVWLYAYRREITQGVWFDETMNTGEDQVWLKDVLRPEQNYYHSNELTVYYRFNGNVNSIIHRVVNGQLSMKRKVKSMDYSFKNVFYIRNISPVGGTETFLVNLGKKYGKDFDICVYYQTADPEMLSRIRKYLRTKKYRQGEEIRCERLFCNINTDILADVVADEYYQIIHANYKVARLQPNTPPEIRHFIGVSQSACDVFAGMTGKTVELSYNPLVVEKPRRALKLISATRLTRDKGADRMKILADALNQAGVPFTWDVYTDFPDVFRREDITVHRNKSNIIDYIASADYLVQLSDAEGLCYSIEEALSVGTPVIVTDIPTNDEIGVINGENGWILPLGMDNIPVAEIEKGIKKFKWTPPADRWGEILAEGQGTYQDELKQMRNIVCTKRYFDVQMEKEIHMGDHLLVSGERAEHLVDAGLCKYEKE